MFHVGLEPTTFSVVESCVATAYTTRPTVHSPKVIERFISESVTDRQHRLIVIVHHEVSPKASGGHGQWRW